MIFAILIFGAMVAAQLFYGGSLEGSTRIKFWVVFTLLGFIIGYMLDKFYVAAALQGIVVIVYFVKGFQATNNSSEV